MCVNVQKPLETFHIAAFSISMTINVSPIEKNINIFKNSGPSKPVEILWGYVLFFQGLYKPSKKLVHTQIM